VKEPNSIISYKKYEVIKMNVVIKNKIENKAMQRLEIEAQISFEKVTPSRKDIQKEIAKQVKANEKLTVVRNIYTKFGKNEAIATAHIYSKEDVMKQIERKNLVEKHAGHEPKAEDGKQEA
jgi:ribosomal protein S24E